MAYSVPGPIRSYRIRGWYLRAHPVHPYGRTGSGPSIRADSRGTIGTTRRYQQEWQGSPSPTGPEGTTWFPMGTTRFPMGTVSVPICPNTGYLTSSLYRLFQSPSCYKHPTFSGCPSHVVTIGEPIAPWIQ